jgi:hypothetical protein
VQCFGYPEIAVDPERDLLVFVNKFKPCEMPKSIKEEGYQESDDFCQFKQEISQKKVRSELDKGVVEKVQKIIYRFLVEQK